MQRKTNVERQALSVHAAFLRIMLLSFDGRTQEKWMEVSSIGFLLSTKMEKIDKTVSE